MEDEDVDNVNSCDVTAIEEGRKAIDDPLALKKDVKKLVLPAGTFAEGGGCKEESINNFKNSLDCNDKESGSGDSGLGNDSQKVNGEVDKNENVTSPAGESVHDNGKVKEDAKRSNDKKISNDVDGGKVGKSKKRKVSVTVSPEGSNASDNEVDEPVVESKGSKKRKVQDGEKEKTSNSIDAKKHAESEDNVVEEVKKAKPVELRRSARNAANAKKNVVESAPVVPPPPPPAKNSVSLDTKLDTKEDSGTGDQLTEYAQYLGLQPTLKFKCGRCGEKHFQSMAALNAHQTICCKTVSNVLTKQTKPQSDSNLSANFRITRKVYLCSACGTYYENWKLFLHMRDVHKRHICLFCLGMFSVAERLADHLLYQHNVHEKTCKSPEEFLHLFKGSCYLTCCSCEKMFTEREHFYDHPCKDSTAANAVNWSKDPGSLTTKELKELAQKCALCGVKCGHFRTCPKVAHKFQGSSPPSAASSNMPNNSNNLERFYIPVASKNQKIWPHNDVDQDILKQALSSTQSDKDFYDAASFCHVDMAANDSDNNIGSPKSPEEPLNSDEKSNYESHESPRLCEDNTEMTTNEESECNDETDKLTNDHLKSDISEKSDLDLVDSEQLPEEPKSRVTSDEDSDLEINDVESPKEKEVEKSICSPKELQRFDEFFQDREGHLSTADNDAKSDVSNDDDVISLSCSLEKDDQCDNDLGNTGDSLKESVKENEVDVKEKEDELVTSPSNHTVPEDSSTSVESDKLTENVILSPSNAVEEIVKEIKESSPEKEDKVPNGSPNKSDYETLPCSLRLDRLDDSLKYMSSLLKEDKCQPDHNSSNSSNDSVSSSSSSCASSSSSRRSSLEANNINTEDTVPSTEAITSTEDSLTTTNNNEVSEKSGHSDDIDKDVVNDNKVNDLTSDKPMPEIDDSGCNSDSETQDSLQKSIDQSSDTFTEVPNASSKEGSDSKNSDSENDTMDSTSQSVQPEGDSSSNLEAPSEKQPVETDDKFDQVKKSGDVEESDKQLVVDSKDDDDNVDSKDDDDNVTGNEESPNSEVDAELDKGESNEDISEKTVEPEETPKSLPPKEMSFKCDGVTIQLANEEVLAMALTLEDKMESLNSKCVVKECVRTSCTTCSYCSHAVKIGVNGKQLAIHLLTEHRYMPVKNETTDDVIERLKDSLAELQDVWFNTDSYDSSDKSCFVPYDHTYECFQCNYVTNTHKDLFSHKRKVHQKTILYCSMCKENFYSYSELLCHMCPGLYDATKDIHFRCCLCDSDRIPSAFRLMVHLRKAHHTCDICLEIVDDQQKLSAHMVKHKLHHLCYRCGIAYRNKPDITKHLFWKHGTESVMCKKCFQKKWPHVYHFCVPPTSFLCEECNLSFSKAVYLKVHKRFHSDNLPYSCEACEQKFVSKKLLVKHEKTHVAAVEEKADNTVSSTTKDADMSVEENDVKAPESSNSLPEELDAEQGESAEKSNEAAAAKPHKKKNKKDKEKKMKPVVDVYDLPPLNLSSESDDTDDEKEVKSTTTSNDNNEEMSDKIDTPSGQDELKETDTPLESLDKDKDGTEKQNEVEPEVNTNTTEPVPESDETAAPVTVVDGIWDNFHSYKAEQEKREHLDSVNKEALTMRHSVLDDHDYCLPSVPEPAVAVDDKKSQGHSSSMDHDYCSQNKSGKKGVATSNSLNTSGGADVPAKKKQKSPKKKAAKGHNSSSSSDSSSDSDSSSCSCGTNCSCSSSSSNSSSSSSSDSESSSSDGKLNTSSSSKREKKKERSKSKKKGDVVSSTEAAPPVDNELVASVPLEPEEQLIRESDLETDETITDEEFYDQYPQMRANQILSEKRNQLMMLATVAPTVNNGTLSPVPELNSNSTNINLDAASSPKLEIITPPVTPTTQSQNKRKTKAKKRRKSSFSTNRNRNKQQYDRNVQLETPPQPSTSAWQPTTQLKCAPNDHLTTIIYKQQMVTTNNGVVENVTPQNQGRQGNSSKRSSKRRRVRNKFYGYSSEEDAENQQMPIPPIKWKKSAISGDDSSPIVQQQSVNVNAQFNNSYQQHSVTPKSLHPPNMRTMFDRNQLTESTPLKRPAPPAITSSSSGSEEEDSDVEDITPPPPLIIKQPRQMATAVQQQIAMAASTSEKDDKLYCYCQCPYDEVSEMIACDGSECSIEWFHFECVGIMVPPKGKWYCPHCRKKRGLS